MKGQILIALALVCALAPMARAAADIVDRDEVLERYHAALGGLD